jgi:hypothetical protein
MAPSTGAIIATIKLAIAFPNPSWAVLMLTSAPKLQYFLKKTGKNPAMTVVAKAEFAQSYIAQPQTAFLSLLNAVPPYAPLLIPDYPKPVHTPLARSDPMKTFLQSFTLKKKISPLRKRNGIAPPSAVFRKSRGIFSAKRVLGMRLYIYLKD